VVGKGATINKTTLNRTIKKATTKAKVNRKGKNL